MDTAHSPSSDVQRLRRLTFGVATAAVALAVALGLNHGDDSAWTAVSQISQLLVAALATGACLHRAMRAQHVSSVTRGVASRRDPIDRALPWWVLTAAMALWTLAQTGWTMSELLLDETPPTPSVLDAPYLGSAVAMAAGVVLLAPKPESWITRVRSAAEGLMMVAGIFLISWVAFVSVIIESPQGSALATIVNLAYPALDAIALAAAVSVATRVRGSVAPGLGFLMLGITCVALADSAFLTESWRNGDVAGVGLGDPLWVAGWSFVGLGAIQRRSGRWVRLFEYERLPVVLPAIPAIAGALVSGWFIAQPGEQANLTLMGITAAVVILGLVSKMIVVWENQSLAMSIRMQAHFASEHDPLTGLLNRAAVAGAAAQNWAAGRQRPAVAIVFDIDGLKKLNDTLGRAAGDAIIREIAERFDHRTRESDIVARSGDDEFLVVTDGPFNPDGALQLADRLMDSMTSPVEIAGDLYDVTLHAGVAMAALHEQCTPMMLLERAEIAMHHGRLRNHAIELFTPNIFERAEERFAIESKLRRALADDQLRLVYQPVFELETMRLRGFEALLRWTHPDLGSVSPAVFVPVAEESGLMAPIGEWVMHRALAQQAQWNETHDDPIEISINVSVRQLSSPGFLDMVRAALAANNTEPSTVVIEVTETALMDDDAAPIALRELRELGLRVAIDDFGTGYASLSYLDRLPADIIKIDESFVRSLGTEDGNPVLVDAIVNVARAMTLETVAEGIELPRQLEILRRLGCDHAQGFLLARPMEARHTWRAIVDADVAAGLLLDEDPVG